MYDLVNDIEAYPCFLPWCADSKILSHKEHKLTASLTLVAGKIRQTFTTENTMQLGRRIDVKLVSGPFKHLSGYWQFDAVDDNTCQVSLLMEFEFKNKLLKLALDKVFGHIINSLIEAYTQRAYKIYAKPA